MTNQPITWDNDLKPAITLHDLFIYAGHTMTVGIFEDETSNDISWSVASTRSVEITTDDFATTTGHGFYPRHFAELEACEILSELIVTNNKSVESVLDMAKVIKDNANRCIARNVFDKVA